MLRAILDAWRRAGQLHWSLATRARLRRHGMRATIQIGHGVRLLGRPALEVDPQSPTEGGGSLALSIGANARIGRDLVLDVRLGCDSVIEIGEGSVLQDRVRLQARGGAIRLADHVQVRDYCELKSAGELTLGSRTTLGRNVTLHCVERVALGAWVGLAERVTITDSDHGSDGSDTWFLSQPLAVSPVVLEENAFVATNAVVLRGVTLGRNAVVAAGAVVTAGDFAASTLVGGVPARTLKDLRALS